MLDISKDSIVNEAATLDRRETCFHKEYIYSDIFSRVLNKNLNQCHENMGCYGHWVPFSSAVV